MNGEKYVGVMRRIHKKLVTKLLRNSEQRVKLITKYNDVEYVRRLEWRETHDV